MQRKQRRSKKEIFPLSSFLCLLTIKKAKIGAKIMNILCKVALCIPINASISLKMPKGRSINAFFRSFPFRRDAITSRVRAKCQPKEGIF